MEKVQQHHQWYQVEYHLLHHLLCLRVVRAPKVVNDLMRSLISLGLNLSPRTFRLNSQEVPRVERVQQHHQWHHLVSPLLLLRLTHLLRLLVVRAPKVVNDLMHSLIFSVLNLSPRILILILLGKEVPRVERVLLYHL